jgi:hypothetical protein
MLSIKLESQQAVAGLKWITQLLAKHNITYQITGGLAAKVYGSERPLADIDLDLPNEAITKILPDIENHLVYGPSRYQDLEWDILLATLNYHGQLIDLSGADDGLLFDKQNEKWVTCEVDFKKINRCLMDGIQVPVIAKNELIKYKSSLRREVDLLDISAIYASVATNH